MIKKYIKYVLLFIMVMLVNGIFRKLPGEHHVIFSSIGVLIFLPVIFILVFNYYKTIDNGKKIKHLFPFAALLIIVIYFMAQISIGVVKIMDNEEVPESKKHNKKETVLKGYDELDGKGLKN